MDKKAKSDPIHDLIHDDDRHPAIDRIVAVALDASEGSDSALKWGM
jgi:hypothetical protein